MERDVTAAKVDLNGRISTHTLTWSVTRCVADKHPIIKISTHTLTWSVTEKFIRPYAEFEISTHTLTWSVTSPSLSCGG